MFSKEMIAPCGLNCAICKRALQKNNPCQGCRGSNEFKSNYCLNKCSIWKCEKLKKMDGYCDQCNSYPCEEIMEKEIRYANSYPFKVSVISNLKCIRNNGIDYFIEEQRNQFTCSKCGGTMCVHTGHCSECENQI